MIDTERPVSCGAGRGTLIVLGYRPGANARLVLAAVVISACVSGLAPAAGAATLDEPLKGGDFAGSYGIGHGRTMYLECHGEGSPTVILDSGLRNGAAFWSDVQRTDPADPERFPSSSARSSSCCPNAACRAQPRTMAELDADLKRQELESTNPDLSSVGRGSKKHTLVEVAGVEPASSELLAGLLRAQPVRRSRTTAAHRRPAVVPTSL